MSNSLAWLNFCIVSFCLCLQANTDTILITFQGDIKNGDCYEKWYRDDIFKLISNWEKALCLKMQELLKPALVGRPVFSDTCTTSVYPHTYNMRSVSFSTLLHINASNTIKNSTRIAVPIKKKLQKSIEDAERRDNLLKSYQINDVTFGKF
uniref:Uncharacterized protein n=1 Tax=Trichobilharzia regenti TaxID=157069 RepID=A0AA85IN80_TRIRE|nr:unnamed protein product [Trichobilharzia regenti]